MNTRQLIERWPLFDDDTKQVLLGAISSRGKYKGYLLSNAPSEQANPIRYMAWQALISNIAPVRVSVWGLTMSRDSYWFHILDNQIDKNFMSLLNAVEPDLRWNLAAMRMKDRSERLAEIEALLSDIEARAKEAKK